MLLWLPDVLRAAGCMVIEYPGWETRGRDRIDPQGIVWHHTATPRSASDLVVRKLLAVGRSDLAGPLCQLGLERDGAFVVIAAGRANHAGYGEPWGNDSIGIEAYNDGRGEPWPRPQVDAYRRGTAAICRHLGWDESKVRAHREVDPNRKVDPVGLDMHTERAAVKALLTEEDDMTPEQSKMLAELHRAFFKNDGGKANSGNLARRIDAIYTGVKGLSARDIADTIPDDLAQQVVDELKKRL